MTATTLLYHGSPTGPPKQHHLTAGPLTVLYENGFLRHIRLGKHEVLRMIYFALRDEHWGTMSLRIRNERIEQINEGFSIHYTASHFRADTELIRWQCQLSGDASGQIKFHISGEVLTPCRRNRVGFCVLHPIVETVGKQAIISPDTGQNQATFPETISPDQPFFDIHTLTWPVTDGLQAVVAFEGDVFETEDQRNWTDASFKTYCTPQTQPKPVQLHTGDTIEQSVRLNLLGNIPATIHSEQQAGLIQIKRVTGEAFTLPVIGTGYAGSQPALAQTEIALLQQLHLNHLRVDADFRLPNWLTTVVDGLRTAQILDVPIALAIVFTDTPRGQLTQLSNLITDQKRIQTIQFFNQDGFATDELIQAIAPPLRQHFPTALLGTGGFMNFVDYNRNRFTCSPELLDFVVYGANPQIHAFDNLTILENMASQGDTVRSAHQLAGKAAAVHVSPITLRPRAYTDLPGNEPWPDLNLPYTDDYRQPSLFAAGWLVGSLKYLAESGVAQTTYFETHGQRGLFMGNQPPTHPDVFHAAAGQVFPIWFILHELSQWQQGQVWPTEVDKPLVLSSLLLEQSGKWLLLVANHTWEEQPISLSDVGVTFSTAWFLDETTADFIRQGLQPEPMALSDQSVRLRPFGIGFILGSS